MMKCEGGERGRGHREEGTGEAGEGRKGGRNAARKDREVEKRE